MSEKLLNNEVFELALKRWGAPAQIGMCIEEMGETLTAINHLYRGRITQESLIEEFVDVYIMMSQMRFMNKELFDSIFKKKVKRIRKKLGLENE